tara:strand:- start:102 stop:311 length:210 start_codon:yes stop_codon:yes gene_type:complete
MEINTTKLSALTVGLIGVILLPLAFIWSMNNVFSLNVEYTFINWVSVAFLQLYLQIIIKASTLHPSSKK